MGPPYVAVGADDSAARCKNLNGEPGRPALRYEKS
jgi:hypothetical protein